MKTMLCLCDILVRIWRLVNVNIPNIFFDNNFFLEQLFFNYSFFLDVVLYYLNRLEFEHKLIIPNSSGALGSFYSSILQNDNSQPDRLEVRCARGVACLTLRRSLFLFNSQNQNLPSSLLLFSYPCASTLLLLLLYAFFSV